MPNESKPKNNPSGMLATLGRALLRRMESTTRPYEKRIVKYNIIGLGQFDYRSFWELKSDLR